MMGFVQIVTLDFLKFNILYQGKESPAKTKLMTAKLRAVFACADSDSAQCLPARSHLLCEYLRLNEF